MRKINEECGVFAIYDKNGYNVAKLTYAGLFAIQHRGQEACGIAVASGNHIELHKNTGHVNEVFHQRDLEEMKGTSAIGHVKYSTSSNTGFLNAQPMVSRYITGQLAFAMNGTLANTIPIKHELESQGAVFQTVTDAEMVMHLLARARLECSTIEDALVNVMRDKIVGSYSIVMMTPTKIIACRDPKGMRPLCLGKIDDTYIVASETCALDTVRAEFIRDIDPGEIVVINKDGIKSIRDNCNGIDSGRICVFEYIYFARSDSTIDGMNVHEARKLTGKILSEEYPVDADLVVGVPDSGIDAAIGYAQSTGIPYGKGLMINRYVGRTFIQPTQAERLTAVRLKINVIKEAVNGKRIVLVDDSIVRGTTSAKLVTMMKEAGAKEVHMRISAPPFVWPCYFGTDIPSKDQLLACNYTSEEICKMIGADSLGFFPVNRLNEIVPNLRCGFCDGCFTGNYPYAHEEF